MAHSVSARKRIRQNETHRSRNRWRLRTMRLAIKDCLEQILHGQEDKAKESLRLACSAIDKSAGKGVIHKNRAARTKSRLVKRMKARQAG